MFRGFTDYAPTRLTATQREVWERIYIQSEAFADSGVWGAEGYTWPAHVASKVVDDIWTKSGRPRALPRPGVMPPPHGMFGIGYALDVQYFDLRTASIKTLSFPQLPVCLWSQSLKAVVIFPRMRIPEATMPAKSMPELLELYRKWHSGKMPKEGVAEMEFDAPVFTQVHPCIAEAYRSDKFDENGVFTDYIHHNDPGARGEHGPLVYIGPTCTMIRGGRLVLTAAGLDH